MKYEHISDEALLKRIGDTISIYRKVNSIKQDEFSKDTGISQPLLSRYESGKVNFPVLAIKGISDTYKIPLVEFFIERERPSIIVKGLYGYRKHTSTEMDMFFDEYISRPENKDKAEVLDTVNMMSKTGLLDYTDIKDAVIVHIETDIMQNSNDATAQRLQAYFTRLKQG